MCVCVCVCVCMCVYYMYCVTPDLCFKGKKWKQGRWNESKACSWHLRDTRVMNNPLESTVNLHRLISALSCCSKMVPLIAFTFIFTFIHFPDVFLSKATYEWEAVQLRQKSSSKDPAELEETHDQVSIWRGTNEEEGALSKKQTNRRSSKQRWIRSDVPLIILCSHQKSWNTALNLEDNKIKSVALLHILNTNPALSDLVLLFVRTCFPLLANIDYSFCSS